MVVTSLAATAADPMLIGLVSTILSGSVVLAIVAAFRAPKQNQVDVVQAQHLIYTELRGELDNCQDELRECRQHRDRLEAELVGAKRALLAERDEINFLRGRIFVIEEVMRRHGLVSDSVAGDVGILERPRLGPPPDPSQKSD